MGYRDNGEKVKGGGRGANHSEKTKFVLCLLLLFGNYYGFVTQIKRPQEKQRIL